MRIAPILLTIMMTFLSRPNLSFSQSIFRINGEDFELSGKWEVIGQLKESGQFHLHNKKKQLNLLISVRKVQNFEFYNDTLNSNQLLEKWYKWEYDHWIKGDDVEIKEIKRNDATDYIIWSLTLFKVPESTGPIKSAILYFVRNGKFISISLNDSNDKKRMSDEDIINFLEEVYRS